MGHLGSQEDNQQHKLIRISVLNNDGLSRIPCADYC